MNLTFFINVLWFPFEEIDVFSQQDTNNLNFSVAIGHACKDKTAIPLLI